MRRIAMILAVILTTCVIGITAGIAQPPEDPGQPGPQSDDDEQADGEGQTGQSGQAGNRSRGPPAHSSANEMARHRSQGHMMEAPGDPGSAWSQASQRAQGDDQWRQRAQDLERLPAHARANMGLFEPDNGSFEGRFVSFTMADDWVAIEDIKVDGVVVFDAISFPPDDDVHVQHAGNAIHFRGADWRFSIVDAPPAPLTMRTGGLPFFAVLPNGTVWQETQFGAIVEYQGTSAMQARFVGPDARDPTEPHLLNVSSSLNFHISAQRVVLDHVANQNRQAIDEALTRRSVGGEVTILRDPAQRQNLLSDVVVFEDMSIQVSPGRGIGAVPENATAHTISVSAEGIPGKTLIVNLEESLVDPRDLHLRYYTQVDEETVEEIPIQMAQSLAHVLDPSTSPAAPRYWIVEDIDGVQLLVLIPNFSTHHIELLSFELEPVTISLIVGALGAVVIVAVATAGLFRRPRDEL